MATEDQVSISRRGGGRIRMSQLVTVTMAAGATTTDSTFNPPVGSWIMGSRSHTPATYSGAPTNINLTIGKTAGAAEYVNTLDVKTAATPVTNTLVNSTDYDSWPGANAFFITLTANAGTNPAGATNVWIDYCPPNF